jgi:glucosylceramidase
MLRSCIRVFVVLSFVTFQANGAIAITGTVTDQGTGAAIQGAIVSLAGSGLTALTDKDGTYSFGTGVGAVRKTTPVPDRVHPTISGGTIAFTIVNPSTPVSIDYYTLSGRRIANLICRRLDVGAYRFSLNGISAASQIVALCVSIGTQSSTFKIPPLERWPLAGVPRLAVEQPGTNSQPKTAVVADSIVACAVGYAPTKLTIESLTGTYPLTLSRLVTADQALPVQSSQAGDRVVQKAPLTFVDDDGTTLPTINVTPATTYQNIEGFGATLNECAVYNLCKITPARKAEVLNAIFNPFTGAGYTLCRTTINSCDFAVAQYTYDDTPGDTGLVNFSMAHDMKWMIPTIKQAMAVQGSSFKLVASPWAPPAWMKTSNNRIGKDGGGGGSLKPDCYGPWANYFVKYINTLKDNGIPVWAVTMQNEPAYDAFWEACVYTKEQERDFLKNSLGPAFERNKIDAKILIWDHNKDLIVPWAKTILGDAAAAKYAWGVAYHVYTGDMWDSMNVTHNLFPNYPIIGTEGAVLETWTEAERMAHEIIGDINHWSGGYVIWNLTADFKGGPYHNRPEPGGIVGPIVVDSATDGIKYFPDYYYMIHFTRYIRPGAMRVMSALTGTSALEFTAVRNLNGSMVVTVLNKSASTLTFKIKQGTKIIKPTISPHALMTFVYF